MTMEDVLEKLQAGFEEMGQTLGKNSGKVLQRAAGLCTSYGLPPDDFVHLWMAFAATSSIELDEDNLVAFERRELSKRKEKPTKSISISLNSSKVESKVKVFGGRSSTFGDPEYENDGKDDADAVLAVYGLNPAPRYTGTPKSEKKPSARLRTAVGKSSSSNFSPAGYSPAIEATSVSYAARTKVGESVLRYKCKDGDYWNDMPDNREPVKSVPTQCTEILLSSRAPFKYMFQTATRIAATLNATLSDTGDSMVDMDKELQDLRVSSTEYCWYLGRIRSEEGRLSQGSTYLEGDLDISGGHVVSLDLSNADEYRLFPGQVVMIKGKNELGKCLRVSEIFIPPILPMPKIGPSSKRPLNVIIACGPYTPIDSIKYEPLQDLIEVIKRDKPDLCILMGPLIDPTHPMIVNGELADTFEELFDDIVNSLIKQPLQDLNTHVVLIPSFKDAHHHPVYPTPPYLGPVSTKISLYPDPSLFEVAGITFGVTSTDILKHLANSEIAKSTITDRMGGLSKVILSQRNLYPLYPPDESAPLDVQLWRKYCKFTSTPHLLIMPSDLRYFIKDVDGTIVVNPERLTKGKSGGTYARLQIKLPKEVGNENTSSVADFCCGEIMKI